MTKTIYFLTTIIFISLTNIGISQEFDTDRVGYQVMCITDYSSQVTYVSNVFYCNEMQAEFDIVELVELKLGVKLSSKTDGIAHFYIEKDSMSEKRDEFISSGKENKYEVILFDVECENGIPH